MVDVLVVGAGIAGFSAAQELHKLDAAVTVLLVDAEARLPYKRTKLSKNLAEGFGRDEFALEESRWYAQRGLRLETGCSVVSIDTANRTAELSTGRVVSWNKLLLATGARPVMPSLTGVAEWSVLRSQDDASQLRERWKREREVVILGNGVLGVEIAEQARLAGKSVRLWGNDVLPLRRELTPAASRLLSGVLDANGVVREAPQNGALPWAVAAIGSAPDLALAQAAGLAVDRGVLVDETFRTSATGVWAAGDGAQLPSGLISHLWHESEAQGRAAARSMAGRPEFSPRPWRLKCEVFGTYWFSMNKPDRDSDYESERNGVYRAFWYNSGRLTSVVMANDKDNAKVYERAVVEGWERSRVEKELG